MIAPRKSPLATVACGAAIVMLALSGACAHPDPAGSGLYRASTGKSFDDVVFDLDFAITERNFRITGRNLIGAGLRERGYQEFPDAEIIHFCSLERARDVLQLDPAYIAQMPCRITVHVENARVIVSGVLLPTEHPDRRVKEFAYTMNGLIREIVDFAAQEY